MEAILRVKIHEPYSEYCLIKQELECEIIAHLNYKVFMNSALVSVTRFSLEIHRF